ncbi:carbamoyltransferase HypF [Candidatus Halobeggiatoa sp. HSG11]|nr:carbamoyltransferase HypF [Candidatus Halobeggiatoa sp. HSG11]
MKIASDKTKRWILTGQVQGVGFRPFVYRLATDLKLSGWVKNQLGQVEIVAHGNSKILDKFAKSLLDKAPSVAKPEIIVCESLEFVPDDSFQIIASEETKDALIHVPPDYAPCDDCLTEFNDPSDRRYLYPFINCTQCGPRFTIINSLPYDRPNTSMANFLLCPDCQAEYENPHDRRFHAEPVACPVCGPNIEFHNQTNAIHAAVQALQTGKIIAVKGIGGYHLMCDACNDEAVKNLRKLKPRLDKPLAVLFPDNLAILTACINLQHIQFLRDTMRPIVLVKSVKNSPLSKAIAPGLNEVGVMLPCSPLHFLLMDQVKGPLVATSANISGEPILTEASEVEQRLSHITSKFLHHNRPIVRPADDSVFRFIQNKQRPIRLGRGCSPLKLTLPFNLSKPTLAVGGQQKNTIALGWENQVVISAHIGDLGSPRSQMIFEQVITDLQRLYRVQAEQIIGDFHPYYNSSRWAEKTELPVHKVLHHHAHASAVVGEFYSPEPWLVFSWDGVGLGENNQLWGGESFYGTAGNWQRVATLRSFAPPGGDKVGYEPWRSALALCWEAGQTWSQNLPDYDLLHHAWQRKINCPATSAVGRLFDGAAALLGLVHNASFEGQGPMLLEAICKEAAAPIMLPINGDEILEIDWQPLIPMLLDSNKSISERSACFHNSLAVSLCHLAKIFRAKYGITRIGLSGGVFQNRVLSEQVFSLLETDGFQIFLGERLPCNDAGLSFGQIVEILFKNRDS